MIEIFQGIFSLEVLDCGCKIKRYVGGKQITIGCNDHETTVAFVCPSCGKACKNKKASKDCAWSHAL